MTIDFHRGDNAEPKGHAFIYMRSSMDHEEIWATYVVILPITVDISKYVPPFLMNQIGSVDPKDLSAFAFPPAPEQVPNYVAIEEMARVRNDDILYVGAHDPSDVAGAMTRIAEAVRIPSVRYRGGGAGCGASRAGKRRQHLVVEAPAGVHSPRFLKSTAASGDSTPTTSPNPTAGPTN